MFRYLLVRPDGKLIDPAVFVTAVPNRGIGENLMVGPDKRFCILDIETEIHEELKTRGINALLIVEPA